VTDVTLGPAASLKSRCFFLAPLKDGITGSLIVTGNTVTGQDSVVDGASRIVSFDIFTGAGSNYTALVRANTFNMTNTGQAVFVSARDSSTLRSQILSNTIQDAIMGIHPNSQHTATQQTEILSNTISGNQNTPIAPFRPNAIWVRNISVGSTICARVQDNSLSSSSFIALDNGGGTINAEPLTGNTGSVITNGVITDVPDGNCGF